MTAAQKHSPAIHRTLKELGSDIRNARKQRGLTAKMLAERASTSRATVERIEGGASGVGIGVYAAVLDVLEMLDRLNDLAKPSHG